MRVLGFDVGTSSVKAAVLETATAAPESPIARRPYELDQPTPETATLDPGVLWQAVLEAGREASAGQKVEGIGFSCLTPALILLGKNDEPLTPIVTHLDRRSRPEAERVWNEVGPRFLAEMGNKPLPGGISALSFRQLANQDARLTDRIGRYLHLNSWLCLKLTGETAFDPANACFTGLFDSLEKKEWSEHWCSYFGVNRSWLPAVESGHRTVAKLAATAAEQLGVEPAIPVKPGTADTSSAMLAAKMSEDGLLHVVGTTQVLAVLVPQPRPAENRLVRPLGVGDRFIHVTHNPVGGAALDWMHQLCFSEQSAAEFYEQTVFQAIERKTDVVLEPPFLGGDRLQIEARLAGLTGLNLATQRLDLLAAVLAAMRRHHAAAVAALGRGRTFRRVFLSGGGGAVVRRLIPDYANHDVVLLEEASLRGVARLFDE